MPTHDETSFHAAKDVQHVKVKQVTGENYAGQDKRMLIYLPSHYDKNTSTRYPVRYLNHGGGDSKWTDSDPRSGGHSQFVLDNLIALRGESGPLHIGEEGGYSRSSRLDSSVLRWTVIDG